VTIGLGTTAQEPTRRVHRCLTRSVRTRKVLQRCHSPHAITVDLPIQSAGDGSLQKTFRPEILQVKDAKD